MCLLLCIQHLLLLDFHFFFHFSTYRNFIEKNESNMKISWFNYVVDQIMTRFIQFKHKNWFLLSFCMTNFYRVLFFGMKNFFGKLILMSFVCVCVCIKRKVFNWCLSITRAIKFLNQMDSFDIPGIECINQLKNKWFWLVLPRMTSEYQCTICVAMYFIQELNYKSIKQHIKRYKAISSSKRLNR